MRGCNALFDYLVGAREHGCRDVEAERLRGLEIDDHSNLVGACKPVMGVWGRRHPATTNKIKLSVIGERTGRDVYRRWPNVIPILCAFVRRAPSVRLNSLETFLTGNFSREYCFKDRRSSFVHSFRLRFVFLAIITPWLFRTLYSA